MAYPHGLFSWTDISLPDPAAGGKFYADLFGWHAEEQHDPEGNYIYTMFSREGKPVAGLGPQPPGGDQPAHPPMWTSYVSVDDVEATVAKWTGAGGTVLMPVMDVMTAGRMAIVADPHGAVLALWQAGEHRGSEVFSQHGAMSWNELNTRDSGASRTFYGDVIGWEFEPFGGEGAPAEYWIIKLDAKTTGEPYAEDKFNGGVLTMDDNWPPQVPPHWMVYFTVDDTDATVAKLESLGGAVSVPPFDTPAGRIAVVGDPQGGTFSLISPGDGSGGSS